MKKIRLTIISTIQYPEQTEPEVIEQQMIAQLIQVDNEWQFSYIEGTGDEQSRVRLFAFEKELIVIRQGSISYQQVYQPSGVTTCQMETPTGEIEMHVTTHEYQREEHQIFCSFTLSQSGEHLGDFQLKLAW